MVNKCGQLFEFSGSCLFTTTLPASNHIAHHIQPQFIQVINVVTLGELHYLSKARNLFQPLGNKIETGTPALKKAIPALHKRIKLIGILLDDDSKAIVEDLQEKQTHFLSQGESIGTIQLEAIREDKVIFDDNGKKIELTL